MGGRYRGVTGKKGKGWRVVEGKIRNQRARAEIGKGLECGEKGKRRDRGKVRNWERQYRGTSFQWFMPVL